MFVRVDRARLKDGAPPRFDTRKGSLASRQGLLGGYLGSEMSWVGLKTVRHDSSRLETKGDPGPNARWKAAPVAWPRWSGRDRLAAFLDGRPKDKEPLHFPDHSRDRCDNHALRL